MIKTMTLRQVQPKLSSDNDNEIYQNLTDFT